MRSGDTFAVLRSYTHRVGSVRTRWSVRFRAPGIDEEDLVGLLFDAVVSGIRRLESKIARRDAAAAKLAATFALPARAPNRKMKRRRVPR